MGTVEDAAQNDPINVTDAARLALALVGGKRPNKIKVLSSGGALSTVEIEKHWGHLSDLLADEIKSWIRLP